MCLARSGGGKRIAEHVRAGCASGEPADGQPVASGQCARVQGAEQRAQAWQWRGEARCATCLFVRFFLLKSKRSKNAKRAYWYIYVARSANLAALVLLGTEAA